MPRLATTLATNVNLRRRSNDHPFDPIANPGNPRLRPAGAPEGSTGRAPATRVRHSLGRVHIRPVALGDVTLSVAEAGAGGRPLLVVHGFTGGKEDFSDWLDPLAGRGWHAVAPDLRGHGDSAKPPGRHSYSPEILVADLLGLASELGWGRFALLGHSMGGALAQLLAVGWPARVAALVLVSTFHGPVPGLSADLVALGVAVLEQGGLPALGAALAARRASDPAAVARRQRMDQLRPGYSDWADGRLLACSADMWAAMAPRFPAWPSTLEAVGAVEVPTLVVTGEDDATMRADCERLAAAVPGARLAVIPGAAHSPQMEAPEAWWATLGGFLDEVAAAARARSN